MAQAHLLSKGRYRARLAEDEADLAAAQRLRTSAFRTDTPDRDDYDALCAHVLVEDMREGGRLVCCFRMLTIQGGAEIQRSYSAQFYDLAALETFQGPMVEMGRFCIHPDYTDPDILRVAWGAMTTYV
ncbi:GNAT family N-acetyltransferase, partial [Cribrihabitans sp. XS_ASV171]